MMDIDVKIIDPRMADQLPAYATPGSAEWPRATKLALARQLVAEVARRLKSSKEHA